jgi:mannose-6-phosphate isomerase
MTGALRLAPRRVAKPWGRRRLWPGFADVPAGEPPVGEIWFEAPAERDPELLVKLLFTAERLSIQVHPDDEAARAAGHPRGKDESWLILHAEPDARIALGPRHALSRDELRAAALAGTLDTLMDWRPVRSGDFIYSPAGTVHALGAGLTLVEVQQNVDLTYRLHDHGRPRELHIDAGVAVSRLAPFDMGAPQRQLAPGRQCLGHDGKFVQERWNWSGERLLQLPPQTPAWLVPLAGGGVIDGQPLTAGQCWLVEGRARLALAEGSELLFVRPARPHAEAEVPDVLAAPDTTTA